MKTFEDFENYIRECEQEVHDDIVHTVSEIITSRDYDDPLEKHEDYRRAWVEVGFMKMIEQYHNWLNS